MKTMKTMSKGFLMGAIAMLCVVTSQPAFARDIDYTRIHNQYVTIEGVKSAYREVGHASGKIPRQYVPGNPLYALELTQHDLRAGLYVPLRVFICDAGRSHTAIDYDLPSSLVSQFSNPIINALATGLDAKLHSLIMKAADFE